ncbi:MAG: hypothetical protein ACHQT8_04290 [Chlamydiales bacterium]
MSIKELGILSAVGAATGGLSAALLTGLPALGGMYIGGVCAPVFVLTDLLMHNNLNGYCFTTWLWQEISENLFQVAGLVAGVCAAILCAAAAGYSIPISTAVVIGTYVCLATHMIGMRIVGALHQSLQNRELPIPNGEEQGYLSEEQELDEVNRP